MHNLKAKKRVISDCEGTHKAKRGRPKLSLALTRYPPLRETGDDEITVQRNNQLLIKEVQKDRPRKEVVCSLARQTYSTRRQKIISTSDEMSISHPSRVSFPQEDLHRMLNAGFLNFAQMYKSRL